MPPAVGHLVEVARHFLDRGEQQVLLVVEMHVEGAARDPGGAGDLIDGEVGVLAVLGELERAAQDRRPHLFAPAATCLRLDGGRHPQHSTPGDRLSDTVLDKASEMVGWPRIPRPEEPVPGSRHPLAALTSGPVFISNGELGLVL